jgi:hypothetical protein
MASRVPAALRARLGDDATFAVIELLDSEEKDWSENVLSIAADRFERRLSEEVSGLRVDLRQTFHDGLLTIRNEMATSRVELLRWSFVFWAGQIAVIAGLLTMMFRITGR